MIDDTLSWSAQIDKITKKVNSGLCIIRKLRDIVDYNTWGCLGKVLSGKLQRLQNVFQRRRCAKGISQCWVSFS